MKKILFSLFLFVATCVVAQERSAVQLLDEAPRSVATTIIGKQHGAVCRYSPLLNQLIEHFCNSLYSSRQPCFLIVAGHYDVEGFGRHGKKVIWKR